MIESKSGSSACPTRFSSCCSSENPAPEDAILEHKPEAGKVPVAETLIEVEASSDDVDEERRPLNVKRGFLADEPAKVPAVIAAFLRNISPTLDEPCNNMSRFKSSKAISIVF